MDNENDFNFPDEEDENQNSVETSTPEASESTLETTEVSFSKKMLFWLYAYRDQMTNLLVADIGKQKNYHK